MTGYSPSVNPLAPLTTILRATADGTIEAVIGGVTTTVELDDSGDVKRVVGRSGDHEIAVTRVFSTGSCP